MHKQLLPSSVVVGPTVVIAIVDHDQGLGHTGAIRPLTRAYAQQGIVGADLDHQDTSNVRIERAGCDGGTRSNSLTVQCRADRTSTAAAIVHTKCVDAIARAALDKQLPPSSIV